MNDLVEIIGILGSFSMAISGALKAMHKQFDPFGIFIIAFVTAIGGGTVRDMLLTEKSVFWMHDANFIYAIILGTFIAILLRNKLYVFQKLLSLFDTIGLGLFTIVGVQIGLDYDINFVSCIILGTITGAFGGVLRDVLVNEVPVIFQKEVYASISVVGGIIYLVLMNFNTPLLYAQVIPIVIIITLRVLVIKFNISLPTINLKEK